MRKVIIWSPKSRTAVVSMFCLHFRRSDTGTIACGHRTSLGRLPRGIAEGGFNTRQRRMQASRVLAVSCHAAEVRFVRFGPC